MLSTFFGLREGGETEGLSLAGGKRVGLLREKLCESIDLQCDRGYAFAVIDHYIDHSPRSFAIYWRSKRLRESTKNSLSVSVIHYRFVIFFRKYYESTIFLAPIQKS